GYFVLIARTLGIAQFGALAAALALVAIAVPFASWGGGNILIMRTARDRSAFRAAFGASLLMIAFSGSVLVLATSIACVVLIGKVTLALAFELGFADLVFARVSETCSQAYQGLGRVDAGARIGTIPYVLRVLAAGAFVLSGGASATDWGPWYLATSVVA